MVAPTKERDPTWLGRVCVCVCVCWGGGGGSYGGTSAISTLTDQCY